MKFITNVARVLVGLLFIFSGFIKLNDPYGLSYKLDEYFGIFAGDLETKQDSVKISLDGPESGSAGSDETPVKIQLFRGVTSYNLTLTAIRGEEVAYVKDSLGVVTDSSVVIQVNALIDGRPVISRNYTYVFDTLDDTRIPVSILAGVNGNQFYEKNIELVSDVIRTPEGAYTFKDDIEVAGFIKADSVWVGFFLWLKGFVIPLAIFLCIVEILLGIALLIGWQARFTSIMLLITIAGFTFLTWYSWTYDKVTDCGCFGDCIPLDPKESFLKDVVLTILILVLVWQAKRIKPFFSNPFSVKFLTLLGVAATGYGLYCYAYLPIIDCLYWKTGSNFCELMEVPEGKRAEDHKIITYHYKDPEGNLQEVIYDTETRQFSQSFGADWTYIDQEEKIIEEAYEPPIHDFRMMSADGGNDYVSEFKTLDKKLLAVFVDLNLANTKSLKKLNEIARQWQEDGYEFFALTSSSPEEAEAFRHEHQLTFDFYFGDNTNLKSIIRSNPGLVLITDTCVVKEKWPAKSLPKYKKLRKLAK